MPISGKVIEVNSALTKEPVLVNSGAFQKGWMMKIEINNPSETSQLLNASAYKELTGV